MPLSTTTCINAVGCLIACSTASAIPSSKDSKPRLLPFPFHEPRGFEKQEHFEDISIDTDEKFHDRCFTFIREVFPGKTKTGAVTSKEEAIDLANKIAPLCKDASQPRCSVWAQDLVATRDPDQHREWCDEMLAVSKEWQTAGIPSVSREHRRRAQVSHHSVDFSTAAPIAHDALEVAKQTELHAVDLDAVSKQLEAVAQSHAKRKAKAAANAAAKAGAKAPVTTAAPADDTAAAAMTAPAVEAPEIVAEAVVENHVAAAAATTTTVTTTTPSAAKVDNELARLDNDLGSLDHQLVKTAVTATSTPAPQVKDVVRSFQNASSKAVAEHVRAKSAETPDVEHKQAKAVEASGNSTKMAAKVTAAPDVDQDLEAMDHLLDGVDGNLKKVKSLESRFHQTPSPEVPSQRPTVARAAEFVSTTAPPAKVATASPAQRDSVNELKSFGGTSTEVQNKFLTPAKAPEVDKELEALAHDLGTVDNQLDSVKKEGASQLRAFGAVGSVPPMSATKVSAPEVPAAHAPKSSVAADAKPLKEDAEAVHTGAETSWFSNLFR